MPRSFAAWLGWLFDGLELHLYTLIAAPLVLQLLHATSTADPAVKEKSAYIQAAFLPAFRLIGRGQQFFDLFVQRVHHRLGRRLRCNDAVPGDEFITRHAGLGDGRQVWQYW